MKEWISMYKFRGDERYAPLLTAMLTQAFQAMSEELALICEKETRKPLWRPDAVTYVPVSDERLAERGFNQAEQLATGLAIAAGLPCVDLLQRQINTGKQSFKSRAERFETMKHAFSIKYDEFDFSQLRSYNKPFKLLLMDDIYTTGSTLDACGQVILHAASKASVTLEIYTLTLARS
ncbi:ComF family protein [Paenibacillus polysaccharolyticus]|nr:ComF family protein [Paenibacillus polysaccharolyticus]